MLPPTIPTSFVPRTTGSAVRRFSTDLMGAFNFISYTILVGVFALALGVFLYSRILANTQSEKNAAVAQAEKAIDLVTVEDFVRLHNRLDSGSALLASHNAFSGFFALLGTLMPATVRFTLLNVALSDGKIAKIDGTGFAKSFNALAAASSMFATDGRIKDAVFSNIIVHSKDSSVSFKLTATLKPEVVFFSPSESVSDVLAPSEQIDSEVESTQNPSL